MALKLYFEKTAQLLLTRSRILESLDKHASNNRYHTDRILNYTTRLSNIGENYRCEMIQDTLQPVIPIAIDIKNEVENIKDIGNIRSLVEQLGTNSEDEFNDNLNKYFMELLTRTGKDLIRKESIFCGKQYMKHSEVSEDDSVDDMIFIAIRQMYPETDVADILRKTFQRCVNNNAYPYIVQSKEWVTGEIYGEFYGSAADREKERTYHVSLDIMSSNQRVYE